MLQGDIWVRRSLTLPDFWHARSARYYAAGAAAAQQPYLWCGRQVALVDRFVAAVKADSTEGENSEVLEALDYVILSKRTSGLHRMSGGDTLPKAA